MSDQDQDGSY